jgi:hypothetical protein
MFEPLFIKGQMVMKEKNIKLYSHLMLQEEFQQLKKYPKYNKAVRNERYEVKKKQVNSSLYSNT